MPHIHDMFGLFYDLIIVGQIYQAGKFVVLSSFHHCTLPTYWFYSFFKPHSPRYPEGWGEYCHLNRDGSVRDEPPFEEERCYPFFDVVFLEVFAILCLICRNWRSEVELKARFRMDDLAHRLLDLVVYCIVLFSTAYLSSEHAWFPCVVGGVAMPDPMGWHVHFATQSAGRMWCYVCVYAVSVIFWLRWLEIALFAKRENARREASAHVVDGLLSLAVLTLCTFGWLYLLPTFDGKVKSLQDVTTRWSFAAPLYFGLLSAPLLKDVRGTWRDLRKAVLPGPHWPMERTKVPASSRFMTNRTHELFMIMLGEILLQLASAERDDWRDVVNGTKTDPSGEWFNGGGWPLSLSEDLIARSSGFVMAACLLYICVLSMPHHRSQQTSGSKEERRLVSTMLRYNLYIMAISLPMIGVGLELAIINPAGSWCATALEDQKALLSVSFILCLMSHWMVDVLVALRCVHSRRYGWRPVCACNPWQILVGVLRGILPVMTIGFNYRYSEQELYMHVVMLTVLALIEAALIHISRRSTAISGRQQVSSLTARDSVLSESRRL